MNIKSQNIFYMFIIAYLMLMCFLSPEYQFGFIISIIFLCILWIYNYFENNEIDKLLKIRLSSNYLEITNKQDVISIPISDIKSCESIIYELFMATVGNENSKCVGKEILMLKIKYQINKESSNYKYSEKAYSLYLALLNEIANFKENLYYQSTDITNKKIIIPNALYDKLDTKLLNIITWLNVMADNI